MPMDSILDTIKTMLGVPIEDTAFDNEIVVYINSSFMVLHQLGVGPITVYSISDNTSNWDDFIDDTSFYQSVMTYIYLSVKLIFDPPATSFIGDALTRQKEELGWRLSVQVPIIPVEIIIIEEVP